MNLIKYVSETGEFLWDNFEKDVRIATRFLNSVIDVNEYPIEKIEEVTKSIRPIGLGAMALGNALYMMKIPYNSQEAYDFKEKMSLFLTSTSFDESMEIAKEVGESYPSFDYELFVEANKRIFEKLDNSYIKKLKKNGVRNSCFTSFAPNGSISFIAGMLSGGIEPVFALAYSRRIEKLNKEYEVVYIVDPIFKKYLDENYDEETKNIILEKVVKDKGSCQNVEEIPEDIRKVFVVASDITPMEHLKSLAIIANNTSLSVSKTINMPSNATKEEISEVYLKAHELGVIGVTVYRDGCRSGILITEESKKTENVIKDSHAPKRPKKLKANLHPVVVHGNKYGVIVGLLEDRPYEIFAFSDNPNIKNVEGFLVKEAKGRYNFVSEEFGIDSVQLVKAEEKAITILASALLRHGVDIKFIISSIKKISENVTDFSTAVCRILTKYTVNGEESCEICPDCNTKLIFEAGCKRCPTCGHSACN